MKGNTLKFSYLLSDGSPRIAAIDGDEFAEADYGLVVDTGTGIQDLGQKLDMLAQAGLQNQMISFSTVMKLYNSASLMEKQRFVEKDERDMRERQAQQAQMQQQAQMEENQSKARMEQAKLEQENLLNQRDNETKLLIANLQMAASDNADDGIKEDNNKRELEEKIRQFNESLKLDREKLSWEKRKNEDNNKVKVQIANSKIRNTK